jgi:hypothetical protein
MRLVDHKQGASLPRETAQLAVEFWFGQDDADVRKGWLAEHTRDVPVAKFARECCDIVELDNPRRLGWVAG